MHRGEKTSQSIIRIELIVANILHKLIIRYETI